MYVSEKRHPEPNLLEPLDVLDEALFLFVIDEIAFNRSDFWVIDRARDRERIDLNPLSILPILPALGHLPQIDLGIKIGGKALAVFARIAINDIDRLDIIEQVFLSIRAIDVGFDPGRSHSPESP